MLRRSARFNFVNFPLGETGEKHTDFFDCDYEFLGTICAIEPCHRGYAPLRGDGVPFVSRLFFLGYK